MYVMLIHKSCFVKAFRPKIPLQLDNNMMLINVQLQQNTNVLEMEIPLPVYLPLQWFSQLEDVFDRLHHRRIIFGRFCVGTNHLLVLVLSKIVLFDYIHCLLNTLFVLEYKLIFRLIDFTRQFVDLVLQSCLFVGHALCQLNA